ncbi:alpha-L-arabinofuranosidase C-terminal domain-containing protein [Paraoerskovia marina]|uniref:alpha-L-arabinofuranosidase C-terminal domain-containing protein n=1 Tax=Paraoerskovia marina TaxID=545619 RepID=UPI000AB94B3E|nr:alpha-L-arabinofuranosidase C-terminal domain-containing protein [Paraoerskovia marina]
MSTNLPVGRGRRLRWSWTALGLAGAMVATLGVPSALALPVDAATPSIVPTAVDVDDSAFDAYVFPYFEGEGAEGEKIYLAVSESDDPETWHTLNDGRPVIESSLGTEGLRDPFLIRHPETGMYYLLATDLKISGGGNFGDAQETGSRSMMVWESADLITWSEQREIALAPATAGNLWAPEAHWDAEGQQFVVYWASALYPSDVAPEDRDISTSYQRMMYATTPDFSEGSFSEPAVWVDMNRGDGRGMIDSTVAELADDDGGSTYYRLTKDERDMTVRQEVSDDLLRTQGVTAGDGWDLIAEQIGVGEPNPWGGEFTNGEGPTMFPSLEDDSWYLMIDQPSYHGGEGYMLFQTDDLDSGDWTSLPDVELPTSPRHGTVVPITAGEQEELLQALQPDLLAEGLALDQNEVSLKTGDTVVVRATVTPVTAGDRTVTWTSDDESVATVESGVITAVADGEATVTATSPHGSATVAVTVAASTPAPLPDGAWVDQFDTDDLDRRWSIAHEEPTAWTSGGGALTVRSQPGDTYQGDNNYENIFLVDVPAGDFVAQTSLAATPSADFQGAGIIAWDDDDNYVRAGLTHASVFAGGPVGIETGTEVDAAYAATFEAREGSTGETLRLARTGDTFTVSTWDGLQWLEAGTTTLAADTTQIGIFALAAGSAPSHDVTFDYFALVESKGADVVPEGPFTVQGADGRYLSDDGALSLVDTRPLSTTSFVATPGDGDGSPVTLETSDGAPVVLADDRLTVGVQGDEAVAVRLSDVGGGTIVVLVGDQTLVEDVDGALVVGDRSDAARLVLVPLEMTEHQIVVDTDAARTEMSDNLYGAFYEDINYAADGGLYAELVRNRSFEFNSSDNRSFTGLTAWSQVGGGDIAVESDEDEWLNESNRFYLTVDSDGSTGVANSSYNEGVAVEDGATYDASVWARSAVAQELTVRVVSADGETTYATGSVAVDGSDEWRQYETTMTVSGTANDARLELVSGAEGRLRLDMVSLFPEDTWVGPVNGKSPLRKDLAEMVAELNPEFLRFPGGCVTNVGTFDTYLGSDGQDRTRTYQWKETLGPVEERPTNWNFWGYNQSYGIGYLEYMEWAEDLGAFPLPVVSVGANGCGSSIPEMVEGDENFDRWVADTVDLVEFAKGDVDTEWGAVRADLGHPEPFELPYIGLGNEENTDTFQANFPAFRDAIEAAAAEHGWDVEIISNSGPDDTGARFDELWEFNREQGVDMVDEHYYNDPSWFLQNTERYDSYDREGPHVFLGEYASRGNTWGNALAEAAYMTGLERNSDLVELASYAPMFANEDYVQWSPDMMWFDNDESWGSVNYWNQHLFMNNVGDEVVPSTHTGATDSAALDGGVFLSTWATQAAYDDVRVTDNTSGDELFVDSFDDASGWESVAGSWAVNDGEYVQTGSVEDARSVPTGAYNVDWSNYTLELEARKVSGKEGFLVGFAAGGANDYYWWNLGGWNNSRSVLQRADGGSAGEVKALEGESVEIGRDYHVKVVVDGRTIELYLDGELQMTYTEPTEKSLYQVVTHDDATGELIVKVVNPGASVARTAVDVTGSFEVGTDVAVTEIVADPSSTNTKADKTNVVPVERLWDGGANQFTYDFPASSVTFLRLAEAEDERTEVTPVRPSWTDECGPGNVTGAPLPVVEGVEYVESRKKDGGVKVVATPVQGYVLSDAPSVTKNPESWTWTKGDSGEVCVPDVAVWDASAVYTAGDRVSFEGSVFEAMWWSSNQEPGSVTGPWQEMAQDGDGVSIWTPSRVFTAGDVVVHEQVRYTARWWTRNQVPGAPWGPWEVTG